MAKINLTGVSSGFNSNTTNKANNDALEAEFQDKVLYRDNPTGEPNAMQNNLDMNGFTILNALASAGDGFTYQDDWVAATAYTTNSMVSVTEGTYDGYSMIAKGNFTSEGTFDADFAAGNWAILAAKGDTGASGSGSGDLVSTNNLADVDDVSVARTNLEVPGLAGANTLTGALTIPDDPYDVTDWDGDLTVPTKNAVRDAIVANIPSLYNDIKGLTIECVGETITYTVGTGLCADSTNAVLMTMAASIAKTSASWVVGAGGSLDTGAVAQDTWYHVYSISRNDTGVVDVIKSLSATGPAMPANYDNFRRIGSVKTNVADTNYKGYVARGGKVRWKTPFSHGSIASATTAELIPVHSPEGVICEASIRAMFLSTSTRAVRLYSPEEDETAVSGSDPYPYLSLRVSSTGTVAIAEMDINTNTSAQIYQKASVASSFHLYRTTLGYYDYRGEF